MTQARASASGSVTFDHTQTATSDSRPRTPSRAGMPATLGRYELVEVLGRGGMGIVYAARDPELDRVVALKVLTGRRDATAHARLRREARTLAKLAHPNVVAVYDVGEQHDQLYVAMAKLEGGTLRRWLGATPRHWSEILSMFVAAGRGLVAAHEAGLVHRDFKPDNVLIDASGQPQVVDFGLARVVDQIPAGLDTQPELAGAREVTDDAETSDAELESDANALTRPGAIMGTPAYMAPEQHLGDETDARTDQFAFCVALWEALYGERPFPGSSLAALASAVVAGRVSLGPQRGVPRAIRRALLRGLESDPRRRWPSLAVLLDVLVAVPRRRRSFALVGLTASLALGLVAGTWALAEAPSAAAPPPVCQAATAEIDALWSSDRAATIDAALARLGDPAEADALATTRARVRAGLDAYAAALHEGFSQACLDTEQRGLVSPERRDLRVACLRERLDAFDAAATLLPTLERESLRQATRVVEDLPAVAICSDLERIATRLPDPAEPEQAAALARARKALAAANAELSAVRIEPAQVALGHARAALGGLRHPPFELELELADAKLMILRSEYEPASERLRDLYHRAFALGHDELATSAGLELIVVLGLDLGEPEQGLAWARHVESLVERRDDDLGRASLLDARGKLEHRRGDSKQAVELLDAALVIRRRELGPRSLAVAHSLNDLSNALERLGRADAAKAALAESLDIKLERLGEFSSSTAGSLTNMGMLLWRAHEYEQAAAHHRHALAVFERAYGPKHRSIAGTSLNLAMALHSLGRADEALPLLERGLGIVREAGGPPELEIKLLGSLGGAHYQLGHWADATAAYERELERLRELHDDASPELASAMLGLAEVANAEGRHADAIRWAEQVLALQPADEPAWEESFDAHLSLAEAERGLGRREAARDHARLARDGFAAIGGRRSDEAAEAEAILLELAGAI